ncbi:MAG: phosphoribosylglycinamide formyltransferase [Candidatus Ventricola sp.]
MKTRIAVLVSGGGTNLQALIDANLQAGEIALVVSSRPDVYALERAYQAGIPSIVIAKKGSTQEAFEEKLRAALEEYQIDLIVLAGFLTILSEDFTRRYPRRILNIHPSLIPAFCGEGFYGLRVHEAALERGVKLTGATVHFVNEIPDGGEIILQKAVEVKDGDTPEILQRRVMEQAEWKLLPQAVELVSEEIRRSR